MKINREAAVGGALAGLLLALAGPARAQLRLTQPSLSASNTLRFALAGGDTNQAYRIFFSPIPSTNDGQWTPYFSGGLGQTAFELPLPTNTAAFFRAGPVAAIVAASVPQALPFVNQPALDAGGLWTNAAANLPHYQTFNSADYHYFRGAFTPLTSATRLAIHSDDGCNVTINGEQVLNKYGQDTHWDDMYGSFNFINYSFAKWREYCIEISYSNHVYSAGDKDGVTLFAYNGGGWVRDGIVVRGPATLCVGLFDFVWVECGTPPYPWGNSTPDIVALFGQEVFGLATGAATITATDADGKSGSLIIGVFQPKITPTNFITCVGVTNTFVFTDPYDTGAVIWSPVGEVSPDTKTNRVAFATNQNTVTASLNGCGVSVAGTVLSAGVVTADPTNLCQGGQVIYTGRTIPPGYESSLNWGGEGLSGTGAKRTNTYSTVGPKVVKIWCGTSTNSFTNYVHQLGVTPASQTVLADAVTPAIYSATNAGGSITWQIEPAGGATFAGGNSGETVSISPGSVATNYAIIAYATDLPSCRGTSRLDVVKVTFSTNLLTLCEGSSAPLTFTVTPASALSLLSFDTVTNAGAGLPNTSALVAPASGSTNLTVTGTNAGTAFVRVKLGSSVALGTVIKTIRVGFPSTNWYVGAGKTKSFSVDLVPPDAPVTYNSTNTAIATVSGTGTNVTLTGVAPGTTQIQARDGAGHVCATKDVTVVSVQFSTHALYLCTSNSAGVSVSIIPSNAPITFAVAHSNILALAVNGTNLTVTGRANGSSTVRALLNGDTLDSLAVWCLTISFPTNDIYVMEGGSATIRPTVLPRQFASQVTFSTSDANVANVSSWSPPLLTISGHSDGFAQIEARVGTNALCASKPVTVVYLELYSVSFDGTNRYPILQDNGQGAYPLPDWRPTNQYPLAYLRNTYPAASARLLFYPTNLSNSIIIKGNGAYPIPPATNLPYAANPGYVDSSFTYSTARLPNQVDFINPLVINWQASLDGGVSFLPIGSSANPVYVTLAAPLASSNLFHTVVHLACSKPGATASNAAVANTWSLFTPLNVTTRDGRPLYYYKPGLPFATCTTTAGLLKAADGNGQCESWARLFMDSLAANGVASAFVTVSNVFDSWFLVKDWTFGTASKPITAPFSWVLELPTPAFDMVPAPPGAVYGDLTSLATLAGQNAQPPAEKFFAFHYITKYNGLYYDPSYGSTYTNAIDFEAKAVAGYARVFGDSTAQHMIFRVKQSVGLNEMRLSP